MPPEINIKDFINMMIKMTKPDWELWKDFKTLTVTDGILLSLDMCPQYYKNKDEVELDLIASNFAFSKRVAIFENHSPHLDFFYTGSWGYKSPLQREVYASEFAKWANKLGWAFPKEFLLLIKPESNIGLKGNQFIEDGVLVQMPYSTRERKAVEWRIRADEEARRICQEYGGHKYLTKDDLAKRTLKALIDRHVFDEKEAVDYETITRTVFTKDWWEENNPNGK